MQTVVVICVMLHVKLGYQGLRCSWEVSSGVFVWKDLEPGCLLYKTCCLFSQRFPTAEADKAH